MARNTTKKATTKAKAPAPAPEATTMPEAHLDPAQLGSMDDASLQQLARDMGLDPAAYPDREALTAAIAEVPVIPGPPEPDGQDGQESHQEGREAAVAVPLVVVRRGTTPRPEDKPIGTMAKGARVTVTASLDGYAMLANGTYIKEVYLERVTP